ncbi:phage holin family protein [Pandoraea sputorum]|uniref:Phage holin family 2 n=1 Tax=Pandoraea sputorum TaxID=93222 RepID=A0A239SHE2_9BURK|nr:phage holin family protein [Pandoraea sputorum]AJC16820.1 holin [Pandoraea sputorum]SNU84308.1 Phage holin family 2 [Pandoraea sputorum]VVD90029.1 holin [Pandoraea sputorum]
MDDHKTTWTILGLLVLGAVMGVGKLLVSDEILTWRLIVGRAILGAGASMIAGVVLIQIPDIPPLALLGIGSVLGTVGAQFIELQLKRRAGSFRSGKG